MLSFLSSGGNIFLIYKFYLITLMLWLTNQCTLNEGPSNQRLLNVQNLKSRDTPIIVFRDFTVEILTNSSKASWRHWTHLCGCKLSKGFTCKIFASLLSYAPLKTTKNLADCILGFLGDRLSWTLSLWLLITSCSCLRSWKQHPTSSAWLIKPP